MIDQALRSSRAGGAKVAAMALSSPPADHQSSLAVKGSLPSSYQAYPLPVATYEEVAADEKLFRTSLEKLHFAMGTKFMIPVIGGKELDLHRLFVVVTSRGGIAKILKDRRWKEVTNVFSFPSTATNASFVLRKYYCSLLYHYEQIYYFKARGWIPSISDKLLTPRVAPISTHLTTDSGVQGPEFLLPTNQQLKKNIPESLPQANPTPSTCSPVVGVIDGKFDNGYLVTVALGAETLKGVLYQASYSPTLQEPRQFTVPASNNENIPVHTGTARRRRRKKSEIKKRDPAHPKPNRSGYNFFFAEQHARLKPLHPGKDRDISRMIGELWNKLNENDRAVYQEIATKDKERYRLEMQDYRERLKAGQVIRDAVPIQQRLPGQDVEMVPADIAKAEDEHEDSPRTQENENSFSDSDYEDDKPMGEDSHMVIPTDAGPCCADLGNVGLEVSVNEEETLESVEKVNEECKERLADVAVEALLTDGQ